MLLELIWMLLDGSSNGSMSLEELRTLASTIQANVEPTLCGHRSCALYWAIHHAVGDSNGLTD